MHYTQFREAEASLGNTHPSSGLIPCAGLDVEQLQLTPGVGSGVSRVETRTLAAETAPVASGGPCAVKRGNDLLLPVRGGADDA